MAWGGVADGMGWLAQAIQARYANDPQKMNEMIAQLYQV